MDASSLVDPDALPVFSTREQILATVPLPQLQEALDRQTQILVASFQEHASQLLHQVLKRPSASGLRLPYHPWSSDQPVTPMQSDVKAQLQPMSPRPSETLRNRASGLSDRRTSEPPPKPDSLVMAGRKKPSVFKSIGKALGTSTPTSPASKHRKKNQESTISRAVHSRSFVSIMSIAISANSILIGMQTADELAQARKGFKPKGWSQWTTAEIVFATVFTIEIIIRLCADTTEFFRGQTGFWNSFDTLLVAEAWFSVTTDVLLNEAGRPNVSFLRTLQILRFFRVLRLLRVTRYFTTFRVLMISILNSLRSLFWAVVMLFFTIYLFAIIILNGIMTDINSQSGSDVLDNYGTIPKALFSLFMSVTGGVDWKELYVPLAGLNAYSAIVFLVYICFVGIGIMNTVTSMFVDSIQKASLIDRQHVIELELERQRAYAHACRKFFSRAAKNEARTLSWEDLKETLQKEKSKAYFASLELDEMQAQTLYSLVDTNGTNSIALEEFVKGCEQFKGAAKTLDVYMLHDQAQKTMSECGELVSLVYGRLDAIEAKLSASHMLLHDEQKAASKEQMSQHREVLMQVYDKARDVLAL